MSGIAWQGSARAVSARPRHAIDSARVLSRPETVRTNRPFRLVLPDLGDLYAYIEYYLEQGRGLLLSGSPDPGTFFIKTVKTTSRNASYLAPLAAGTAI